MAVSPRIIFSSRSNSLSEGNKKNFESFLKSEVPVLPPEIHPYSDTSSIHSGLSNDFTSDISFNQLPEIDQLPLMEIHPTIQTLKSQEKSYYTKQKKQTKKTKKPLTESHQTIPDHLAAAIELNTTNTTQSSAPASGMYWSRCLTFGPSRPVRAHTSNLIGEKLYVFGGCDTSTCFDTLYILNMDTMTWSIPILNKTENSPPPCRAHSMTVVERDLGHRKSYQLLMFGGGNGPEYFQELYVFEIDTLSWSRPRLESQLPPRRRAHTSCVWENKLVVIGGGDGACALDDVYMLCTDKMVWERIETSGAKPPARGYHTNNLVKDKLIVFGGSDGHDCFEDVYVLDLVLRRWSQVVLDFKIPRLAHTSTQVGSYVFVVGGHDGRKYTQEVLLFNLVTMSWEVRKVYGTAPSPRGYHTAVLYDSRLYIIGGYDGKNVFDEVFMLELSACAYLPQITNFEIDV